MIFYLGSMLVCHFGFDIIVYWIICKLLDGWMGVGWVWKHIYEMCIKYSCTEMNVILSLSWRYIDNLFQNQYILKRKGFRPFQTSHIMENHCYGFKSNAYPSFWRMTNSAGYFSSSPIVTKTVMALVCLSSSIECYIK